MGRVITLLLTALASLAHAFTLKVDVNIMPRVVFTGDSQTCGRAGAMDYPQMLARELPIRAINTAVGGTNIKHLLTETSGGTASVRQGERAVKGTRVGWHAGPYPGQKIRLGCNEYTIDRIETISYAESIATIWITEPAREDFNSADYTIEPGWRVRVADQKPDYVCCMYSVNDVGWTSQQFRERLEELTGRIRAIGAQPMFLSSVPLMDAAKGGSLPNRNDKVAVRANDLATFCAEEGIPFGDVFHTLMFLDEPCTSVWADTVHPTTDGSTAILTALRTLLRAMGLADNPYYVKGYRSSGGLIPPDDTLVPFTTSQPDYTAQNLPNENLFDLAAIRQRDEYGLIAHADNNSVRADTPIFLRFGVGVAQKVTAAEVEVVTRTEARIFCFHWDVRQWKEIACGEGRCTALLKSATLRKAIRQRAVWIAIAGTPDVALDYIALTLQGAPAPYSPRRADAPIVSPQPGELEWRDEPSNLIRNGNLTHTDGGHACDWQAEGAQAIYLPAGIVARGVGDFVEDKRGYLFRAAGQQFLSVVRPLDMLRVPNQSSDDGGNFLIAEVVDDATLRMRRFPKTTLASVTFEVVRTSGCAAVAGGCRIQSRNNGYWQTRVTRIGPGRYRLRFFYRAFDPAHMRASSVPGKIAQVTVLGRRSKVLASTQSLQVSYQWQRGVIDFTMPQTGPLVIRCGSSGERPVEFTGFSLHALSWSNRNAS